MRTFSAGRNKLIPEAGFTLMELLVVLGILSMVYLLISPLTGRILPGTELKTVSEQLAGDLRSLRSRAVLSGQPVHLYILENGRAWGFSKDTKEQELPRDVLLFLNGSNDEKSVRFYPDGKSSGFELILKLGERVKIIRSDWVTGKISVE